jgi:hypothetical protein
MSGILPLGASIISGRLYVRSGFERWAAGLAWPTECDAEGIYIHGDVEDLWEAFQAGAELDVPAGYKLVPIAATTEMVYAIEREMDNQLIASGIMELMHRQDGQHVWDAAIAAWQRAPTIGVSVNASQPAENEISPPFNIENEL